MKTYTEKEVIALLIEERERAMKICQEYHENHLRIYWEKRKAGNDFAFVNKDISETSRFIKNSISGISFLSHSEESIEKKITENLKNKTKLILNLKTSYNEKH